MRALAVSLGGGVPAPVETHTFLFPTDIVTQPTLSRSVTEHPIWGPQMGASLRSVPAVSLVTGGAISGSERETSFELIFPGGEPGLQVGAGVEHFGGHSLNSPKKNMRLSFKRAYGPPRLRFDLFGQGAAQSFDQVLLRTGSHDTWFWTHPSGNRGVYLRGRWAFDRQLEMGQPAPRGRWVQVFINGDYHGLHHLMERPNAAFMASYLGGEKEDYEALNAGSPIDGDGSAWGAVRGATGDYEELRGLMDVGNYADYMLLQFYCGNDWDWNHSQNWMGAGRKLPAPAYKFFAWDSDVILRTTAGANVVNRGGPGNLWGAVSSHAPFRAGLADRAHRYFTGGGVLTTGRVVAQIDALAAQLELPVVAECARWGAPSGYTPAVWREHVERVKSTLVEGREQTVLAQLRAAGVYPAFDPPSFSLPGGVVPAGASLVLDLPANGAGGEIWYTLDGTDPRGEDFPPGATETVWLDQGAPAKALIATPESGAPGLGLDWTGGAEPFDDGLWESGVTGVGYDYAGLVGLDVGAMRDNANGVFVRVPFAVTAEQIEAADGLRLDMKAEDGFVAYLNGVEVAALQRPAAVTWDALAAGSTGDGEAVQFRPYDLTAHLGLVRPGENVLAFHALNHTPSSSDLLCLPRLAALEFPEDPGGGDDEPAARRYTAPIVLDEPVRVKARVRVGAAWSALEESFYAVAAEAPEPGDLAVSELHYNPAGGDGGEFLELVNLAPHNLLLDGVELSDGVAFTFPPDTVLAPGAFIVVAGSAAVFDERYRDASSPWYYPGVRLAGVYSGALDNGGEAVAINDASGRPLLAFSYGDGGAWPGRADGRGSSLELGDVAAAPNVAGELDLHLAEPRNWRPSSEYHGSPGRAGSGADNRVVINEVLSRTDPPLTDAAELYNRTGAPVDLSRWFLSDDADNYRKFRFPAGTVLEPGGFLLLDEADFNPGGGAAAGDFALDGARGDDLYLLQADTLGNLVRFVDRAEFGAAAPGESLGRWPDGASGSLYPLRERTLGAPNQTATNGVRVGNVVISEIMYNPPGPDAGLEFVELYNRGAQAEDLTAWRLRGEADFDFADGEVLDPGATLVVVGFDPEEGAALAAFIDRYPGTPAGRLRGPWTDDGSAGRQLDNDGAELRLLRAGPPLTPDDGGAPFSPLLPEDTVNYNDAPPWPDTADDGGPSLQRRSTAVYGDDPNNWLAPAGATPDPGRHTPPAAPTYEEWAEQHRLPAGGAGANGEPGDDFDRDGLSNFLEYALAGDPRAPHPGALLATRIAGDPAPGQERFILLTFSRPSGAAGPDGPIEYLVETSADLASWEPLPGPNSTADNGDDTETVTYRDTIAGGSRARFVRVRVAGRP